MSFVARLASGFLVKVPPERIDFLKRKVASYGLKDIMEANVRKVDGRISKLLMQAENNICLALDHELTICNVFKSFAAILS